MQVEGGYNTDKPVAILGVADQISDVAGEPYTVGIFHHDDAPARLKSLESKAQDRRKVWAALKLQSLTPQLLWLAKDILTRPPELRTLPR